MSVPNDYLEQLLGGTIINIVYDEDEYNDDFFWGLTIRLPSGEIKTAWILRDPEGNGPGYLQIND